MGKSSDSFFHRFKELTMTAPTDTPLSYKAAGVDIEAADDFVSKIASLAKATHTAQVVPGKTAYAGLVRPVLRTLAPGAAPR